MKLANRYLNKNVFQALNDLLEVELPIKKSWELRKFYKQISEKSTSFQEEVQALIKKYGEENKKGVKEIKNTNKRALDKYQKLLEIEEEYLDVSLSLKDLKNSKIKPKTLVILDFLIKE